MWEQTLPTGHVSSSSVYCTSMHDFQDSLIGKTIRSIEISAGSTTRTCNDVHVANQIASAFSACKIYCSERSFSCNGNIWVVGTCGHSVEISVDSFCQCSGTLTIRPCVDGAWWGGAGDTCSPNSMILRISVTVEA